MKPSEYCIIYTTTDSKENAKQIIDTLLSEKLAACIQSSLIESAYHWEGKIIESPEILLRIKTKSTLFGKIQERITLLHTYETPEIIMVPLADANSAYLRWITQETHPE